MERPESKAGCGELHGVTINGVVYEVNDDDLDKLRSLVQNIIKLRVAKSDTGLAVTPETGRQIRISGCHLDVSHSPNCTLHGVALEEVALEDVNIPKLLSDEKKPYEGNWCMDYFRRWRQKEEAPPLADKTFIAFSTIGSFLGISFLAIVDAALIKDTNEYIFITASFGAQAVLLFGAPTSALAQPWNAVFGNGISATVGVCLGLTLEGIIPYWILAGLSVSIAVFLMSITKSLHPPGGATAMIALAPSGPIREMGFLFIMFPIMLGSITHVLIALMINNIQKDKVRNYPVNWAPI
mmetsp:Transcript_10673/g.14832  ORF Transcript_10673/g.14832 Transcript_10673/m.14832 type:complete len:296 (+) Transcript_10673:145-1032(+)|eukprot:CAMPEP_0184481280 /NCGR_PEP_ID=MMETSP0113_2-20130426/2827_1 /TAXON_ID=91329 /ORGANISM="Norrisiella sphaerica, Strain BC52" /LENGTH=295 /DNA_ID=CAMNT_0026860307 /DNA_START=110 /DNA_END=997 /DNA_ORIENTATION=+